MTGSSDELTRMRARLERERRARRQAEVIAEAGMRELWETNRSLQQRIDQATDELRRDTIAARIRYRARLDVVSGVIDTDSVPGLGELLDPPTGSTLDADAVDAADAVDVRTVADRVIERWQLTAAQRGQLLTVEVRGIERVGPAPWARAIAVIDLLLAAAVRHGEPGRRPVLLGHSSEAVTIALSVELAAVESARGENPGGPFGAELQVVERVVADGCGALDVTVEGPAVRVAVSLPAPGRSLD